MKNGISQTVVVPLMEITFVLCPKGTGSLYFNYKSYFLIMLLAIVDAQYKFTWIDVGAYGKDGNSGIFQKSSIYQLIHNNNILLEDHFTKYRCSITSCDSRRGNI